MKLIVLIITMIAFLSFGEDLGRTETFVRSNYGTQIKNPKDLDVYTNYLVGKNKLKKVKKIKMQVCIYKAI